MSGPPVVIAQPERIRRVTADPVGTAFLVAAVVGSGIAATRLSPGQVGLQLLENALITGAALVAVILDLQPVSAAFAPVVTLLERAFGALSTAHAAALIAAELAGGFPRRRGREPDVRPRPDQHRPDRPHRRRGVWLAEVVATVGLLLVIFGTVRSGRTDRVVYAVGAYITAAYWFTSSTSFANPAVTVARMFSDTFAGIAPTSVAIIVLMQLVGGLVGWALIRLLFPAPSRLAAALATADPHSKETDS